MAKILMNTLQPRIDAHMHWWTIRRDDYGWLTPNLPALYGDFGAAEAEPLLAAGHIDGVILVQAAPTEAETQYLIELAQSRPYVRGVVGWADLYDAARLEVLARDQLLVAVRPMLEDLPAADWILQPELAPAVRLLEDLGLPFEALIKPHHLPVIRELLERYPRLRITIDHAAKPDISVRSMLPWKTDLAAVAKLPTVACKLSGLATEAKYGAALRDFVPYVDAVFALFGPERVIWGSDWPVLIERLDYLTWLEWAEQLCSDLTPDSRASVFGGNAERFYARRSVKAM